MANRADQIIDCNPAPVLPTAADHAPQAQSERSQHLRQSASQRTQDHADSQVDDPHSRFSRRFAGRFPVTTQFRQKTRARAGHLGQNLGTTVTVVADRRCANQYFWGPLQLSQRFAQKPRRFDPTASQSLLDMRFPADRRDVFTSQVNNGIRSFQPRLGQFAGIGIPRDVVGFSRLGPRQSKDLVSPRRKERNQRRTDQSRSPRDQYLHGLLSFLSRLRGNLVKCGEMISRQYLSARR